MQQKGSLLGGSLFCNLGLNAEVDFFQNNVILCIDSAYEDGVGIMETRKVFKSGNSLVVSLPKGVIDSLAIREGQPLGFEIIVGGVTIKPLTNARRKGIIKKVAGCLKDDKLAQEILSLRDEDDREVKLVE